MHLVDSMGSVKFYRNDIDTYRLKGILRTIFFDSNSSDNSDIGDDQHSYADEAYIDFKEPLDWGVVLGNYKYNSDEGFDALDYLFDYLTKMISSDKYVFSRGFLRDRSSYDETVSNKLETLSEIIDILNSSSSGNERSSDIIEFLYKPLYKIREDYLFVKHSLSFDHVDIPDDALEWVKPLFEFYRLDVLSAGEGSIKRKLVYNPPENESDGPYFKIDKWADVLLCFPVDENHLNHRNLSIDLSVLEGHLNEDEIRTLTDRSLIEVINGNGSEKKVKLTANGSFVRRSIFNRQKDKLSGLLVPREFMHTESPINIGELIGSDRIK